MSEAAAPAVPGPRLIGVEGAAAHIGIGPRAVYRLVESGRIPFHRIGRRVLFSRVDLDAWMDQCRVIPDTRESTAANS